MASLIMGIIGLIFGIMLGNDRSSRTKESQELQEKSDKLRELNDKLEERTKMLAKLVARRRDEVGYYEMFDTFLDYIKRSKPQEDVIIRFNPHTNLILTHGIVSNNINRGTDCVL